MLELETSTGGIVGGGLARGALLVALVCAGCGDSAPGGPGAAQPLADASVLVRLELRQQAATGQPEPARIVARIPVPEDVAEWEVVADTTRIVPAAGGGDSRALRMTGKVKDVVIPGQFDPRAFNGLRIVLEGSGEGSVSVLARRAGRPFAESAPCPFEASGAPRVLEVELPQLGATAEPFDQLLLHIEGRAGSTTLHELVLTRDALASFLPPPQRPDLVQVGKRRSEARSAFGLSTADPVGCRLDVVPGMQLAFAYGVPESHRARDQELELLVHVSAAGAEPLEQSFALEARLAQAASWHEARLSLARFAGQAVRLSLSLRSSDGREACCVVAEPRARVRGRGAGTVLLVTSDTHRADHLGAARSGVQVDTPVLDALAQRGVLFEDCYSSTNVTQPSHTALLTGFSMRDHGVIDNSSQLSRDAHTLAEAFQGAGFRTFGVVSVKHLDADSGLGQGFDRLFAPGTTWTAAEAIGHLESCLDDAAGEPVFVWLHLFDAHAPYAPPAPFDRCYYPQGRDPRDPALPEPEIAEGCIPESFRGIRDLDFPPAQYRAEVRYLDHELGRLLERERMAEAVIAVTADHGEVLERAGSYFNHASLCPATLHVPLVLAWPGGPRGARVARPVEHIDLGRTLLDLAGLDGREFPGRNLTLDAPPAARFAIAAHGRSASVTLAGWHFVLNLSDHTNRFPQPKVRHAGELYRLADDPECLDDIARDDPDRARRLRQLLVEWLADTDPTQGSPLGVQRSITPAEAQQLEALGYADGAEAQDDAASGARWIDPDCECARCTASD